MSAGVRQSRLETLLERVRKNASVARRVAQAARESSESLELDEPGAEAPAQLRALPAEPPLVTSAAPAPRAPLESTELDVVEDVDGDEIDLDDVEEAAPASHSSPVAGALEHAIDSAEHAPPLTPPPESGAELTQAPAFPPAAHLSRDDGPTMAQLGETISLEEGPSRDFELDEPMQEPDVPREAPLATGEIDLEKERSALSAAPVLDRPSGIDVEATGRPAISANVVDFVGTPRATRSFAELVDASLGL